jgi:hypothetical protein
MTEDTPSVADVLAVFQQPKAEKPDAMWRFLLEHAEEAVAMIATFQVDKWDIAIAELLGRIGSPRADRCASFLVWLVADPNAPARPAAATALFSLSTEAIIAGTYEVAAFDPGALDCVLWEARYRKHAVADELVRKRANKAPEPTTFAVTSRAAERVIEMKQQNPNCDVARAAPAKVVAHL